MGSAAFAAAASAAAAAAVDAAAVAAVVAVVVVADVAVSTGAAMLRCERTTGPLARECAFAKSPLSGFRQAYLSPDFNASDFIEFRDTPAAKLTMDQTNS